MAGIIAAANAALSALNADANYCASVAQPGSSVNTAVHAFKQAWNDSYNASDTSEIDDVLAIGPVPIGTGNYESATAVALQRAAGSAPDACGTQPQPQPQPQPIVKLGLPTWAKWLIGLVITLGVVAVSLWAYRRSQQGHRLLGFGAREDKKRKK